jgi:hypothetical protein
MSVKWDDKLTPHLERIDELALQAVVATGEFQGQKAEVYMRTNAPWTDRTGNARSGLHAFVQIDGHTVTLVLSHRVNYGIWLEVANSGRYAIVTPAIRLFGRAWMQQIKRVVPQAIKGKETQL